MSLDSEIDLGEIESAQPSAVKPRGLYQGTTSAVPERYVFDGLQPLCGRQGLKPSERTLSAARLKPRPDTRRPTSGFGMSGRVIGEGAKS